MMMNEHRTDRVSGDQGFTLIELLVVVIILGILAAIAIPTFMSQRERSYRAAVKADLRNAVVAEEVYFTDMNSYTADTAQLVASGFVASGGVTIAASVDVSQRYYCLAGRHLLLATETWYRGTSGVLTTSAVAACPTHPAPVIP